MAPASRALNYHNAGDNLLAIPAKVAVLKGGSLQRHTIFEQIEAVFPRLAGRTYRVYPELPEDLSGVGIVRVGKFKAIAVALPPLVTNGGLVEHLPNNLQVKFTQEFLLFSPWTIFTSKIQLTQTKNRVFQENLGEPSIEVRLDQVASGQIGWVDQMGVIFDVEIFSENLETLSPATLRAEFWQLLETQLFSQGVNRILVPLDSAPTVELAQLGYRSKSGFMQKTAPPV